MESREAFFTKVRPSVRKKFRLLAKRRGMTVEGMLDWLMDEFCTRNRGMMESKYFRRTPYVGEVNEPQEIGNYPVDKPKLS